ncbi:hypothetical protein ATANTOWER_001111, partial [Ataeniobius toweri]|nr:hypothetical protein [Ataeniobius toweri]
MTEKESRRPATEEQVVWRPAEQHRGPSEELWRTARKPVAPTSQEIEQVQKLRHLADLQQRQELKRGKTLSGPGAEKSCPPSVETGADWQCSGTRLLAVLQCSGDLVVVEAVETETVLEISSKMNPAGSRWLVPSVMLCVCSRTKVQRRIPGE